MIHLSFPRLYGELVNLRELSIDDATIITNLISSDISKNLFEVPYPYKIDDALKFIKSSSEYFKSYKAIIFAIDYKNETKSIHPLVGTIGIKDLIILKKSKHRILDR